MLTLDEPVGETVAEWKSDARKRRVTLRMLLSLTSGIAFGGLGNAVPTFEAALQKDVRDEPASTFTYGGVPLQVFGAVLSRKLRSKALTPQAYLHERILEPAGVRIASWRRLKDGSQPLPTGVFLTARDWLTYGRFVAGGARAAGRPVVSAPSLAECFRGSSANPRYGLGWWLDPLAGLPDTAYASGSGGQALYIVPAHNCVAVHFGKSGSWRHEAFLKRLFPGS